MPDVSRRSFAGLLGASITASQLPLVISGCSAVSTSTAPDREQGWYIDGLSFLPTDLSDIRASKIDAFICDISAIEQVEQADGTVNYRRTYRACMESIRAARARVAAHPDLLRLALAGADARIAKKDAQTALFFQIQGADCVEESLSQVDEFYLEGLRVLQLTHHYGNVYAGGALDSDDRGGVNLPLSARGYELIEKLNQRGILIDLSHASARSAQDAIATSSQPVVLSHGAARAIVNHARCSPDGVIRAIADGGGVFGVFMMSFWLTTDPEPQIRHYVEQLRHVADVGGIDAVAIANDYPLRGQENLLRLGNDNSQGIQEYLPWWQSLSGRNVQGFDRRPTHVVIPELNNLDRMARIHDAILGAGFSASEADKVMGGNWLRVLEQVV
ncbi:MAG: dipeptidase [Luminiphilus sp.]|nr:dipeptidase [Luminiphilus sp.]